MDDSNEITVQVVYALANQQEIFQFKYPKI